jgi:primosomal protein N' (replication factor Y)
VKLADIALPVPLPQAFTYEVPTQLAHEARAGSRVIVSFGNRKTVGVVLKVHEGEPPPKVKRIERVLPDGALPEDLLSFLVELSRYYFAPVGEVMKLALPPVERDTLRALAEPLLFQNAVRGVGARKVQWVLPASEETAQTTPPKLTPKQAAVLALVTSLRESPLAELEEAIPGARAAATRLAELGMVRLEVRDKRADPLFDKSVERDIPPVLTDEQATAFATMGLAIESGSFATFVLHGVTGAGKTEVYLRAIERASAKGKGSILLVPEIALTPQLVSRFRARFGDDVGVIHSGLSAKERHAMWMRLRTGVVNVAIGARSAVFAPVANLGLVIVDEEHDPSFKQEEGVRYNARDMAMLRAHRAGGVCVLGSATPSLESELLVRTRKAVKLRLRQRAHKDAVLPKVEIIDLRRTAPGPTGDKRVSLPLHGAIEKALAAKGQIILFLNRRGFSPSVRCESCGDLLSCPDCSVAMTYHKGKRAELRCHYCDRRTLMPEKCGKCGVAALSLEGLGTEKLEETLSAAFPEAKVARLDRDVASSADKVESIMAAMRRREIDILVGTQMVTKGHDLPDVTLVGVINADAAISMPDFRAGERAFQLLVQVAGRAGRGERAGRVLVQTYDPTHHAIIHAAKHDVDSFVEQELADRKELFYPPYSRSALVRVDGPEESAVKAAATELAHAASAAVAKEKVAVEVKGPAPAPVLRIRGRFRYRVLLHAAERSALRTVLLAIRSKLAELPRAIGVQIDVDPMQLL